MIWPGGEYYYATKGNGRLELAMYYAFCYGTYVSSIKPVGAHSGWGNVNWTFNNTQAAQLSFRSGTSRIYQMPLPGICAEICRMAEV